MENYEYSELAPVILEKQELTNFIGIVSEDSRKYLDREEINNCLQTINDPQHRMICTFMWMTGLRVSEVIDLKFNNIDFTKSIMRVTWLKKRKRLERIVPLHKNLVALLRLYTSNMKYGDTVFPISRQMVHKIVKRYFPKWFSSHSFRHSFSVNYLRQADNPNDLVILQKLLGHNNIQTTMEYLKVLPVDQKKQLDKIVF